MESLKVHVDRLLFKRRTIFKAAREEIPSSAPTLPEGYVLSVNPHLPQGCTAYAFLAEQLGEAVLDARLRNPSITLFLITEAQTGQLAGYYWAVTSHAQGLWHDNFPIPRNCALLFNAVVMPKHRRSGLYRALIGAAQQHLLHGVGLSALYTVVEDQNTASLRANQRFGGKIVATNFLIKVLGVNAFSVYRNHVSRQVNVHYVFRNSKSNRF